MWMSAPSSVSSVRRRSSSRTPSPRRSVQSPPPGSTFPRSRGPSKWPLAIGAVTRVPCGTAPIFCGPTTATCKVINRRDSIRPPPFAPSSPVAHHCRGERLKLAQHGGDELRHGRVNMHGPSNDGVRLLRIHDVQDRMDDLVATGTQDGSAQDVARLRIHDDLHETLGLAFFDGA